MAACWGCDGGWWCCWPELVEVGECLRTVNDTGIAVGVAATIAGSRPTYCWCRSMVGARRRGSRLVKSVVEGVYWPFRGTLIIDFGSARNAIANIIIIHGAIVTFIGILVPVVVVVGAPRARVSPLSAPGTT